MPVFLLILSLSLSAWASLNTIKVKNADAIYVYPQGSGEMDKIEIDMSKARRAPFKLLRTDEAFIIDTELLTFNWTQPADFVRDMKAMETSGFNLQLARGESFVTAETLNFTSKTSATFSFLQLNANCQGKSIHRDPFLRFLYDCESKADISVHKLDIPLGFLDDLATRMPPIPDDAEMPADDLKLTINEGALLAQMKVKFLVRATMKVKGHFQFENDHAVAALRVDEIKFGILPVTNIVLNELARTNQNPDITVTPPWIRIKLKD